MSELSVRVQAGCVPRESAIGEPLLLVQGLRVSYHGGRRTGAASGGAPGFTLEVGSLSVRRRERVAILGASGSGKTTLLRAVKGLVRPDSGEVALLTRTGSDSKAVQREAALIYQQFNLVGRSTVYENILGGCLGRLPAWRAALGSFPRHEREAALRAALELGLADFLTTRADRLSGGQQQRVAIARVIVQRASLVLADEPIASLDPETGAQVLDALLEAAALHGQGLLISLHDPDVARAYADRIVGLRDGQVLFDHPAAELGSDDLAAIYRKRGS